MWDEPTQEQMFLQAEAQSLGLQAREAAECGGGPLNLTFRSHPDYWKPIDHAPRDGSLILVRDYVGNVDIARWDRGEWTSETGKCEVFAMFAEINVARGLKK